MLRWAAGEGEAVGGGAEDVEGDGRERGVGGLKVLVDVAASWKSKGLECHCLKHEEYLFAVFEHLSPRGPGEIRYSLRKGCATWLWRMTRDVPMGKKEGIGHTKPTLQTSWGVTRQVCGEREGLLQTPRRRREIVVPRRRGRGRGAVYVAGRSRMRNGRKAPSIRVGGGEAPGGVRDTVFAVHGAELGHGIGEVRLPRADLDACAHLRAQCHVYRNVVGSELVADTLDGDSGREPCE